MNDERQTFLQVLDSKRRVWRLGALACSCLKLLRLVLVLGAAYAALDLFLAFSADVRWMLNAAGIGVLLFAACWELIRVASISRSDMASRADQVLGNRRQSVLSALELQQAASASEDGLRSFLVGRVWEQARLALSRLPTRACVPRELWARELKRSLLVAIGCGALVAASHPSLRVALTRILHPGRDIPPFSPYRFAITPEQPKVLFGGTLEFRVRVSGAAVREPVYLLTRKGAETERSICFREGDDLFSQRLDKVVDPLEFCFATGKARSHWQKIDLLLQPRISVAKLVVEPPAYTHLSRKEVVLGQETFEGLKGSKAELRLTSNRPLSSGALKVTSLSGLEATRMIAAEKAGMHTVVFRWEMQYPARLEAIVQDVQGTPSAEPMRLTQQLVPDLPPEAVLESPGAYVLATPVSRIPVQGRATDDLALRNVELIRTVVGFRDRMLPLGPSLPEPRFQYKGELDLRQLGVAAGQVLELYLEARDFNPERTGIGASPISRIEVIPESEYAELVRAGETLDQFSARYEAVQAKLQEFQKALEDLERELAKPNPDPENMRRALDTLRQKNREARELFSKMAGEFQAYATEQQWSEALREVAERLEGHGNLLDGMAPGNPKLGEVMRRLRQDFNRDQQRIEQQVALAEELAAVGRVMEHASRFQQLIQQQRQVVRWLRRFEANRSADGRELPHYGRQEQEVLRGLQDFLSSLPATLTNLPESAEYAELRESALTFARELGNTDATNDVRQAGEAALRQEGPEAYEHALRALEKLEALLAKREESQCKFAGLCRGRIRFEVREELSQAMAQMLSTILSRGSGVGEGRQAGLQPGGGAGDAQNGFSVPSHTRLNTPVFGPARGNYTRGGGAQGQHGQGGTAGKTAVQHEAGRLGGEAAGPRTRERARTPELTPEKYREAVKKYFQQTQPKP